MIVFLNNKELQVEQSVSIVTLLESQAIVTQGVAVAVNNRVVKRELWAESMLSENDKVTVIVATFGG